jgi:hypothetical protein
VFSKTKLKFENEEGEIEEFAHSDVGRINLSYLFAGGKNCENELSCLQE